MTSRSKTPVSASTVLRELNDPAARLFQAVQRYTDGLHVAAEQLVGTQTLAELDQADQYIPGLTTEPAWPTLRAHLVDLAAEAGKHPLRHLLTAAAGRDLETAGDMAAVLYWRLPELAPVDPGPLPWLPGIPARLHSHPAWVPYLAKRSQLVADLADQIQIMPTKLAPTGMGCTGKPPEHGPRRRHCSMAGRQRHQSPRSTTNRRNSARNASGPVETTPRPGHRAWHQPARRCEGRASHTQDALHSVQGTSGSARTNDPNGVPAGRPRPADSTPSRHISALRT